MHLNTAARGVQPKGRMPKPCPASSAPNEGFSLPQNEKTPVSEAGNQPLTLIPAIFGLNLNHRLAPSLVPVRKRHIPTYSGTPFFEGDGRDCLKSDYFRLNKREINHLRRSLPFGSPLASNPVSRASPQAAQSVKLGEERGALLREHCRYAPYVVYLQTKTTSRQSILSPAFRAEKKKFIRYQAVQKRTDGLAFWQGRRAAASIESCKPFHPRDWSLTPSLFSFRFNCQRTPSCSLLKNRKSQDFGGRLDRARRGLSRAFKNFEASSRPPITDAEKYALFPLCQILKSYLLCFAPRRHCVNAEAQRTTQETTREPTAERPVKPNNHSDRRKWPKLGIATVRLSAMIRLR
jgi:hypothetical protein